MVGAISPYTREEIARAARCISYLDGVFSWSDEMSPEEIEGVLVEQIDKLERRGVISDRVAALLAETYAVPRSVTYAA